jgi:excisionase family DNA binding protein
MTNVVPITGRATGPAPATRPATKTRPAAAVYTVAEVAELLGLSLGGTYAAVRAGEIPARRMGDRWVIPKRRFDAWLDESPSPSTQDGAANPEDSNR